MEDRSILGAHSVLCVSVKTELECGFQQDELCWGSLLLRGMEVRGCAGATLSLAAALP